MSSNTKSLIASFIHNDVKNKTFIIPPYQRLYAWKDEQIKALLDDFENCIEHNKNQEEQKSHFIGNIVVSENDDKYILIDGQQRLTTIWLVFKHFEKNHVSVGEYFNIEMPIREEDTKAIDEYCKGKSLDKCFNDTNNTNAGFKNAFKTFEVYFGKDNEEDKQQFIKFIREQVKFNLVILGDQVELNKYFVRMNNTGVQLDGTDILKARLLKLISDYEEKQNNTNKTSDCEKSKAEGKTNKENKVTKYARIFDECSQMNYFTFCYEDKNQNSSIKNKNLSIKDIIDNHKINKEKDKKQKRAEFESIIDFPTFVLHVFKILSRQESTIFKKDIKISIKKDKFLENTWDCLEFNNNCGAIIAIKIIRALKNYRIIFDTFVIKRKADDEENEYKLWNRFRKYDDKNDDWNEVDNTTELKLIQNYLRVARRGDNTNYHHFLTHYLEFCKNKIIEEQTEITNENCLEILKNNADKLKDYLKNIDDFLAYKTIDGASNLIETLDDFINKACTKKDINFDFLNKGTNTPHYWFYRLEYYLLISNYSNNNKSYRFRYVNSVEHVLAQNDSDGLSEDGENKKVLNNFGNIALITDSENSTFSNNVFTEKKRIFDNYKNKDKKIISLKLLDVYENKDYQKDENNNELNNSIWKKAQIKKHQEKMLEVLQKSFENT
ncbi:DUF262 domain-containing protein [Campylobacter sp. 2018MI01]|uniref:DUF262 domain-containing protein n=1 Tax=Campylobacter sp. 2018MI01 TaxID=2836735 RepID=UPI001BDA8496|nr:DUF262 domain-containing protein [Campylobacter sp. 2018MI01]MBT0878605.1 DUF262 domain-containing protein [Campylobacter sp. 2018MI01]